MLISDLGGGKTTFVKGLALGMGIQEQVSSPSFTLRNEYAAPGRTLYHFDFYRLSEPGIIKSELEEILSYDDGVVAVEWPEIVDEAMPKDHVTVNIRNTGENSRQFIFEYGEPQEYLFEDAQR